MSKRAWDDANLGDSGTAVTDLVAMLPTPASLSSPKPEGQGEIPTHHSQSPNDPSNCEYDGVPVPPISKKIKACVSCRKRKIRCLMGKNGPPCTRCATRNSACVLNKNLQTVIDEKSQFPKAVVQDLERVHGALENILTTLGLPALPPLRCLSVYDTEVLVPMGTQKRKSNYEPSSSPEGLYRPSFDNLPRNAPEGDGLPHIPIHSLYRLTDLSALRSPEDAETVNRARRIDDFISRGLVTLTDAESLFALYRDRLDRYMYNIGCHYDTLEELRKSSSILSAATLAVAALHSDKSDGIYKICKAEFRRLMEESMFERSINRDYLRAMCLASNWLSDISWIVSGYAIRRAAELPKSYWKGNQGHNEEAADYARLWYALYICDEHLATLYKRQSISRDDSTDQEWRNFLELAMPTNLDKGLMGIVALIRISRSVQEQFGHENDERVRQIHVNHLSSFSRQLDQWYEEWAKEMPASNPETRSFPRKATMLYYNFAQVHLYARVFQGLSTEEPVPTYLFEYALKAIAAATTMIEVVITDQEFRTGLMGMPSYMYSMTAFASTLLVKVAIKFGGTLVEIGRVYGLITSLVHQFRSQQISSWHLAGPTARGLERMLGILNTVALEQSYPVLNGIFTEAGIDEFENIDALGQTLDADGSFLDLYGDLSFNGSSLGSPSIFQGDLLVPNIEGYNLSSQAT
ncbi:hypothetical protein EDB81DRAFT_888296 [Dactylonectria macrodidyma]|uniref:Zn(2)-C6 fungal-type domain-containing protein n=1 Tax=Dactylonectria macrodidyma TaxID=307937 RepID=A0A9P9ISP1_9HYPO|nr:hypothetical protein EDB81DRAFT_888296 [Dactylonectria macrodidyma]